VAITTFGLLAGLTGTASAAATKVDLGDALDFGVLATAGITNTGVTTVRGDIGSDNGSIIGAEAGLADTIVLTGGGVNRADDTGDAQADLDAASLAISAQGNGQVVGTPDLGARTTPLTPDVYSSASTLNIDTPLVLDGQGSYDSVFIFRAGTALNTGTGGNITLVNGAQSCNIFWQVGSATNLLAQKFVGNVLGGTESISLGAGVTVDGRLLAPNAQVTLINDTITQSRCRTGPVTPSGGGGVLPPVVVPPVVAPPVDAPPAEGTPVVVPPAEGTPLVVPPVVAPRAGTPAPSGASPRSGASYSQVGRVPVGSVDTGDGSTAVDGVASSR
jgi:hypothetical protein